MLRGAVIHTVSSRARARALAATYQVVDRFALAGTQTEAFAWCTTAVLGGFAAGSARGGAIVEVHGAHGAWIAAIGSLAVRAGAALGGLRRHRA